MKKLITESLDSDCVVLTCDGYTTSGNPGLGGYIITNLEGEILKKDDSEHEHSNNYFELLGIWYSIKYAIDNYEDKVRIYTDSATCLAWIKNGKCSEETSEHDVVMKIIALIKASLVTNSDIELTKWVTSERGEIPADPSRK